MNYPQLTRDEYRDGWDEETRYLYKRARNRFIFFGLLAMILAML